MIPVHSIRQDKQPTYKRHKRKCAFYTMLSSKHSYGPFLKLLLSEAIWEGKTLAATAGQVSPCMQSRKSMACYKVCSHNGCMVLSEWNAMLVVHALRWQHRADPLWHYVEARDFSKHNCDAVSSGCGHTPLAQNDSRSKYSVSIVQHCTYSKMHGNQDA